MALIEVFEKKDFTQSLDGDGWSLAREDSVSGELGYWREISVPSCWEIYDDDRATAGPFWYKRTFYVPETPHGARWMLEFDAINYFCEIYVNKNKVGEHEGGWSGFSFDVHDRIVEFGDNELLIKVLKQGGAGERFPMEQCLAGFMPYVGVIFGGIWKSVRLTPVYAAKIENVHIKTDAANERVGFTVLLSGDLIRDVQVDITVCSPHGDVRITKSRDVNGRDVISDVIPIDNCVLWDTDNPHLYQAAVRLFVGGKLVDKYEHKFGMRTFCADAGRLLLNGQPIHLRGALHWGWNSERIAPIMTRAEIRAELEALRRQGFNMVKHCLYIPNKEYYEVADELGFLIWQELLLWLPVVTDELTRRTFSQYQEIYKEIRNHPSIVLWTLGCELEKNCPPAFLEKLYNQAKRLTNGALIRDNSGSAECYGVHGKEYADFYDYHFYTDPHFFGELLANFAGSWRVEKPWLFGEFCDYDTTRNVDQFIAMNNGSLPWWMQENETANPTLNNPHSKYAAQQRLMLAHQLPFTNSQIYENGVKSAYEYRKLILEQVRAQKNINGYVITSIKQTPLATSAIFDDNNIPKHKDEAMLAINNAIVLFLSWDNHRAWINGGDRAIRREVWNYFAGDMIRPHIMLSNMSRKNIEAIVEWQFSYENGETVRSGTSEPVSIATGVNNEIEVLELFAPETTEPQRLILRCKVTIGEKVVRNSWIFTVYPRVDNAQFNGVLLADPLGQLQGLEKSLPTNDEYSLIITTMLTEQQKTWVETGGKLIYIQTGAGEYANSYKPFWRESVQLFYDHPLMNAFPHQQHTGTAFYSLATDNVFVAEQLPPTALRIMDRLDARKFDLDCYMFEQQLGVGRIIATTLRFGGGLGTQASGIDNNPAALYWLAKMVEYLRG
ncbi:MAG: sugar-binding domain-containing protein [Bacillota bacterium]